MTNKSLLSFDFTVDEELLVACLAFVHTGREETPNEK